MNRVTTLQIALVMMCFAAPVNVPAASLDELESLRSEIATLNRRLDVLESQEQERIRYENLVENGEDEVGASPLARPDSNTTRFNFDGDFRYRYEEIELGELATRQRSRIRARASVATDIAENMEIGLGVSTGGIFPTSSTQTLGNGGSKKSLTLDLAYVDWQPTEGMHLLAGKFRNNLYRVPSQILLWDDEWRPDGFGVLYDNDMVFASFLGTWLESDSFVSSRERAMGAQAGLYQPIGEAKLTVGAGYFDFGIAGKGTFFGPDLAFAGNSFSCSDPQDTASCVYVHDYRIAEVFAALDIDINDIATTVYGHAVKNLAVDRFDSGWMAGVRLRTAWSSNSGHFVKSFFVIHRC